MIRKALKALTLLAMFHLSLDHHNHVHIEEEHHKGGRKVISGFARV